MLDYPSPPTEYLDGFGLLRDKQYDAQVTNLRQNSKVVNLVYGNVRSTIKLRNSVVLDRPSKFFFSAQGLD